MAYGMSYGQADQAVTNGFIQFDFYLQLAAFVAIGLDGPVFSRPAMLARSGIADLRVAAIYVVQDARTGLPYVGRSFNVALRLTQHIAAGKITPAAAANVRIFAGPTTLAGLRKAEQLMINRLGGTKSGAIANMRNEIAPRYWHGLGI
jgi:hypothetical protein